MTKRKPPEVLEIDAWLKRRFRLDAYGKHVLGATAWRLFEQYGRLMAGPKSGLYVSALDPEEVTGLLDALAHGKVLLIHLMHRHVSGNYESSRLLLVNGKLVMRFVERDEAALRSDRIALAQHLSNRDQQIPHARTRRSDADSSLPRPCKRSFDRQFERDLARFQHRLWKLLTALIVWASPQRQGFGRFGESAPLLLEESNSDFAHSEAQPPMRR